MVQKVLCIVLGLWTMPLFMAKHSMKTKYITKQQINYREEDEIINHCHALNSNTMSIKLTRTVGLISQDQSEIPACNIEENRKMKSKDSYLTW